jgi:hypothetical protein
VGSRKSPEALGPVVFDSDVLIWYLRGREESKTFLDAIAPSRRLLPAIVVMELLRGCRDRVELRRLRRFLDGAFAGTVHISEEISRRASALVDRHALSHRITPDDALVAATALTVRAPLATANLADYRFISGLSLKPFRL